MCRSDAWLRTGLFPGYTRLSVRPLLTLFVFLLALSVSGISSAVAANMTDDDCCADGAEKTAPGDEPADGHGDKCPPLCHACACSPTFAVPTIAPTGIAVRTIDLKDAIEFCSQLPASPPGPGVFHPPRLSA